MFVWPGGGSAVRRLCIRGPGISDLMWCGSWGVVVGDGFQWCCAQGVCLWGGGVGGGVMGAGRWGPRDCMCDYDANSGAVRKV